MLLVMFILVLVMVYKSDVKVSKWFRVLKFVLNILVEWIIFVNFVGFSKIVLWRIW